MHAHAIVHARCTVLKTDNPNTMYTCCMRPSNDGAVCIEGVRPSPQPGGGSVHVALVRRRDHDALPVLCCMQQMMYMSATGPRKKQQKKRTRRMKKGKRKRRCERDRNRMDRPSRPAGREMQ